MSMRSRRSRSNSLSVQDQEVVLNQPLASKEPDRSRQKFGDRSYPKDGISDVAESETDSDIPLAADNEFLKRTAALREEAKQAAEVAAANSEEAKRISAEIKEKRAAQEAEEKAAEEAAKLKKSSSKDSSEQNFFAGDSVTQSKEGGAEAKEDDVMEEATQKEEAEEGTTAEKALQGAGMEFGEEKKESDDELEEESDDGSDDDSDDDSESGAPDQAKIVENVAKFFGEDEPMMDISDYRPPNPWEGDAYRARLEKMRPGEVGPKAGAEASGAALRLWNKQAKRSDNRQIPFVFQNTMMTTVRTKPNKLKTFLFSKVSSVTRASAKPGRWGREMTEKLGFKQDFRCIDARKARTTITFISKVAGGKDLLVMSPTKVTGVSAFSNGGFYVAAHETPQHVAIGVTWAHDANEAARFMDISYTNGLETLGERETAASTGFFVRHGVSPVPMATDVSGQMISF